MHFPDTRSSVSLHVHKNMHSYRNAHTHTHLHTLSLACCASRYTDNEGVLMFLAKLMISVSRGTPSVTFLADTPAKWKVFSVICEGGHPHNENHQVSGA